MSIVVLSLAGVLALGPAAPGLSSVSQLAESGAALASPVAPAPTAAAVAGPPTAASVAGPPVAAPVGTPAATPPGQATDETQPPTTTVPATTPTQLPSALGLTSALTEARERQQEQAAVLARVGTHQSDTRNAEVQWDARTDYSRAEDDETLVRYQQDRPAPRISGYGGLSFRGSTLMNNPAVWVGGRGGLLLGERFSIGGAFSEVQYRHGGPIADPNGRELSLRAAYGGVHMGYGMVNHGRFHFDVDMLLGGGKACISSQPGYKDDEWRCIESVKMFVTETGLSTRFDVIDWFRIGMTAGYRFVTRQAWRSPNDFQLSGPYVGLDVDFGWF